MSDQQKIRQPEEIIAAMAEAVLKAKGGVADVHALPRIRFVSIGTKLTTSDIVLNGASYDAVQNIVGDLNAAIAPVIEKWRAIFRRQIQAAIDEEMGTAPMPEPALEVAIEWQTYFGYCKGTTGLVLSNGKGCQPRLVPVLRRPSSPIRNHSGRMALIHQPAGAQAASADRHRSTVAH